MKKHHKDNSPCLIDFYDSSKGEVVQVSGTVVSTCVALDVAYRVTVKTEDGRTFTECHPDCIHPARGGHKKQAIHNQ